MESKVNRVDQPEPGLLSLVIHAQGRTEALLLSTMPGALGVAILERRPKGDPASAAISSLRRHLEGGRIVDVERSQRAVRLSLDRGGERTYLIAAASRPYGTWWLVSPASEIVLRSPGAATEPPKEDGHWVGVSVDSLRADGATVLEAHRSARLRQLHRALLRELRRVRKKRSAIEGDLERAREAGSLQQQATLLLAHAHEIPAGAEWFDAPSFDDSEKSVRIPMRAGRSAAQEAQVLFAKAKRLKRGMSIVPDRLEQVDQRIAQLEALEQALPESSPGALVARLAALDVETEPPQERERKKRRAGGRLPYREFVGEDGTSILVGRGAADNDRLTLRIARPHDLWLHARGVTGAHVVVRLDKGRACPPETLVDAATLAAHYSDLRGETVVDVLYTPRRFVRKPKGSSVGSVTLEREKVIAVRLQSNRLARLLETERRPGP